MNASAADVAVDLAGRQIGFAATAADRDCRRQTASAAGLFADSGSAGGGADFSAAAASADHRTVAAGPADSQHRPQPVVLYFASDFGGDSASIAHSFSECLIQVVSFRYPKIQSPALLRTLYLRQSRSLTAIAGKICEIAGLALSSLGSERSDQVSLNTYRPVIDLR